MKSIAIIPARSGSKGLKDKNIRLLNGKPMLAYSIEAAIKSNCFSVVHVSTDSEKYSKIAKLWGADQRFLRKKENALDYSSTWDVVREVLQRYKELGYSFDCFMILQPTSPLRTIQNIKDSFELLKIKNANAIVSVCEADHSPYIVNSLPKNNSMNHFLRTDINKSRRQDMGKFYRINGAIYLSKVEPFLENNDIYSQNCFAYVMKKDESIDVDDIYDFKYAELIIKEKTLD